VKPKAVDLFSGCGGLTLGLKQAGFRVIAAVESDDLAVETYRANHRRVKVWHNDIRELPVTLVMRHHNLKKGQLDLLAGCPPCQGFSTITKLNGRKRTSIEQNRLVDHFIRYVRQLQPRTVMIENVPGLKRSQKFRMLRKALNKLGYHCNHAVLNAADFNVPQRRRRFMLVAARGKKIAFDPPSTTPRTVRDAFQRLSLCVKNDPVHQLTERRSARIKKLISDIPRNGGSRRSLGEKRQLDCHRQCDGFKDIYGRMSWDKVAPTITGGCCNPSKGRFLHPMLDRTITLREAALLQTFPPDYFFSLRGGKFSAAQMIGNALPPEFIRRHAGQVRKAIAKHQGTTAEHARRRISKKTSR
jgi:DNA (cytosine-5)-methyltransferase 1